jgi:TolB-like protein/Tfp pilus assembly protein PilF
LKFNNIGDSLQDQYFNEGLSEELLNLLARIKELKVASRTSTWALPENVTSTMVREQLGVNYMVEGSVRKSNDKVRITVQLIETQTGFHLWSETYDRKLNDAIAVQDEIALKITSSLKLLLSAQSLKALSANQEVDAVAYEHYLKAKQFLREPKTKTSLIDAIKYFDLALIKDTKFELALAGLCQSKIEYYQLTFVNSDFEEAERNCLDNLTSSSYQSEVYNSLGTLYLISGQFNEAKENFQAALTLDLSSIDALLGLAESAEKLSDNTNADKYYKRAIQVDSLDSRIHEQYASYLFHQGRYTQAIVEFKKVISIKPNYANAYSSLGAAYFAIGEKDRGIEAFHKSLTINENHEAYANLGTAFYIEKKFIQASAMYLKAVNLSPDDYIYWGFLAESYEHQSNKSEEMTEAYLHAIEKAEQALTVNEKDNELLVSLAFYHARVNNKDEALILLKKLENKELFPELFYTMSISYLSINDKVKALKFLSKAVEKGYDKKLILIDENFSTLLKNKRFKEITEKTED